jgi:hypothetical protein
MNSARHVIKRMLNPRFLSQLASFDAASSIHQSLERDDEGGNNNGGGDDESDDVNDSQDVSVGGGAWDMLGAAAAATPPPLRAVGTDGLCSPRHESHMEPSFIELDGIQ